MRIVGLDECITVFTHVLATVQTIFNSLPIRFVIRQMKVHRTDDLLNPVPLLMKRIKIFISSVQSEFTNERSMLCDYIRTDVLLGKFFEPFIFEEVPANEYSPQQLYLKEVEICDIYLGIYGNMYGNEDSEGISPTEREYDLATAMHKDRIIYIKSLNEEARQAKESALINKVEREIVRKTFVDSDSLRTSVYASLIRYLSEKEYIRWQPFDASYDCDATLIDLDEDKMHACSLDNLHPLVTIDIGCRIERQRILVSGNPFLVMKCAHIEMQECTIFPLGKLLLPAFHNAISISLPTRFNIEKEAGK